MAHEDGIGLKAYYNTNTYATPTFTAVEGEVTSTLSLSMSPKDTTDKDDNNYTTSLPGIRGWTISGTAREDTGSSAQDQIIDDAVASSQVLSKVEFKTVNSNKFSGDVYATDISMEAGHDGVITFGFTLTGTGALSYAAV